MVWLRNSLRQLKVSITNMWKIISKIGINIYPFFLMAYRTAVHEATGHSPSQLILGQHLRLLIDLILERLEEESPQLTTSYADHLLGKFEDVHQFAHEYLR